MLIRTANDKLKYYVSSTRLVKQDERWEICSVIEKWGYVVYCNCKKLHCNWPTQELLHCFFKRFFYIPHKHTDTPNKGLTDGRIKFRFFYTYFIFDTYQHFKLCVERLPETYFACFSFQLKTSNDFDIFKITFKHLIFQLKQVIVY